MCDRNKMITMTKDECQHFKDVLLGSFKERDMRIALVNLYNKLMGEYCYFEYFLPLALHEMFVSHRLVSNKQINDVVGVVLKSTKIGELFVFMFLDHACSNIKNKLNSENLSILRKYLDERRTSLRVELEKDAIELLNKYFKPVSFAIYGFDKTDRTLPCGHLGFDLLKPIKF